MKQLLDLLQLLSLKQIIETPALMIHPEGSYLPELIEPLMEGVYFSTIGEISEAPGQYRSIIVADLSGYLPLFHKILEPSGSIYLFTSTPDQLAQQLTAEFKFIAFYPPQLTLGVSYGEPLQEYSLQSQEDATQQLLIASNQKITPPIYRFNIPATLFKGFFKELFVDIEHYNRVIERHNKLLGDLKQRQDQFDLLGEQLYYTQGKQQLIQKNVREMLQLKKSNSEYAFAKNQNQRLLLKLSRVMPTQSELIDLDLGDKIAQLQQNITALMIENCRLYYSRTGDNQAMNLGQVQQIQRQEKICRDAQATLLVENEELVQQANEYVSELSHLRFDLENLIVERDDLMNSLDQVQEVLDRNEIQLKEEEERVTILLNQQFDQERQELLQKQLMLDKKISELSEGLNTLQQYQHQVSQQGLKLTEQRKMIHSLKQDLRQKQDTIHEQDMVIERAKESVTILNNSIQESQQNSGKIKERYQESKKILDQRNNTIQKLKFQLERMKSDIDGQEKVNQKINLDLQTQKQEIVRLKQLEIDFDADQQSLKNRYNTLLAQNNDNYYKNLYDNTEEELQRVQKQLKRSLRDNRDLKEEQKQYELKIQELMGYNERMREQLSKFNNQPG